MDIKFQARRQLIDPIFSHLAVHVDDCNYCRRNRVDTRFAHFYLYA